MANMNFGVNILPKANNTYTLGNSDYKWNIFANTINGTSVSTLLSNMIADIQINGASIINNGIANIPYAQNNSPGVVKLSGSIYLDEENKLRVENASDNNIKAGASTTAYLVPFRQHQAVFYGLAKAAGDSTQSASSNAVGIYTDDAKTAIQNMLNVASKDDLLLKVDKTAIVDAGIGGITYTPMFGGEFTVTTAAVDGKLKPYALASVTGRLYKEYQYRVTINGNIYNSNIMGRMPAGLWFTDDGRKTFEYIGNIGYYISDTSGVTGKINSVDFLITSDVESNQAIAIYTNNPGTYTILVERIDYTNVKLLPPELIWGNAYAPIEKGEYGGSTYSGFSIGVNSLRSKRATFAIGYSNILSDEFTYTIGLHNQIEEAASIALGHGNRIRTGASMSVAIGTSNNILGQASHVLGYGNTVEGTYSTILGHSNSSYNQLNFSLGYGNSIYADQGIAIGITDEIRGLYGITIGTSSKEYGSYGMAIGTAVISRGTYTTALGFRNVEDTILFTNEWEANTSYEVGDEALYLGWGIKCKTANNDATFTSDHWDFFTSTNTLLMVGNGTYNSSGTTNSNAMKLDWNGNEYLNGTLYINCNADSSGGVEVATKTNATSSTAGLMSAADKAKLDNISQTIDLSFSIATTDWTLSNGVYTATYTSSSITSNSVTIVRYDESIAEQPTTNIFDEKVSGGVQFTTTVLPTGTISGDIAVFNATLQSSLALPSVSSSDNGKVLRVVNGEWAAVTIANANGVSF